MRVTITVDSATPNEAFVLTRAFQKASTNHSLPHLLNELPTVQVVGQAFTWTSPPMYLAHALEVLGVYDGGGE